MPNFKELALRCRIASQAEEALERLGNLDPDNLTIGAASFTYGSSLPGADYAKELLMRALFKMHPEIISTAMDMATEEMAHAQRLVDLSAKAS